MKMRILITCPKCGRQYEDTAYVRESEMNGGTIDSDCPYFECSAVTDGAPFKVLGPVEQP